MSFSSIRVGTIPEENDALNGDYGTRNPVVTCSPDLRKQNAAAGCLFHRASGLVQLKVDARNYGSKYTGEVYILVISDEHNDFHSLSIIFTPQIAG